MQRHTSIPFTGDGSASVDLDVIFPQKEGESVTTQSLALDMAFSLLIPVIGGLTVVLGRHFDETVDRGFVRSVNTSTFEDITVTIKVAVVSRSSLCNGGQMGHINEAVQASMHPVIDVLEKRDQFDRDRRRGLGDLLKGLIESDLQGLGGGGSVLRVERRGFGSSMSDRPTARTR